MGFWMWFFGIVFGIIFELLKIAKNHKFAVVGMFIPFLMFTMATIIFGMENQNAWFISGMIGMGIFTIFLFYDKYLTKIKEECKEVS